MSTYFNGWFDFVIPEATFLKKGVYGRMCDAFDIPEDDRGTFEDCGLQSWHEVALSVLARRTSVDGSTPMFPKEREACLLRYGVEIPPGAMLVEVTFGIPEACHSTYDDVLSFLKYPLEEYVCPGFPIILEAETDESPPAMQLCPPVNSPLLARSGFGHPGVVVDTTGCGGDAAAEEARFQRYVYRCLKRAWDAAISEYPENAPRGKFGDSFMATCSYMRGVLAELDGFSIHGQQDEEDE